MKGRKKVETSQSVKFVNSSDCVRVTIWSSSRPHLYCPCNYSAPWRDPSGHKSRIRTNLIRTMQSNKTSPYKLRTNLISKDGMAALGIRDKMPTCVITSGQYRVRVEITPAAQNDFTSNHLSRIFHRALTGCYRRLISENFIHFSKQKKNGL